MEAFRIKVPKNKKKHPKERAECQEACENAVEALELEPEVFSGFDEDTSVSNVLKEFTTATCDTTYTVAERNCRSEVIHQLHEKKLMTPAEISDPSNGYIEKKLKSDIILEKGGVETDINLQKELSSLSNLLRNSVVSETKLYPVAEKVEEDVLIYEPIVKAHAESTSSKTHILANKCYNTFYQDIQDTQHHEFYELVKNFKSARQHAFEDKCNIKNLKHSVKRYAGKFWVSIEKTVNAEGRCGEGHLVRVMHKYMFKELDAEAIAGVHKSLHQLEALLLSDVTLHAYTAQIEKLKIEIYLCDLKRCLKLFAPNSPPENADFSMNRAVLLTKLKTCINVLFEHQRAPTQDEEFITLTRNWLRDLIAELFRIPNLDHNLFILNHILRCPSGISYWAQDLAQLPLLPLWSPDASVYKIFDGEEFYYSLTSMFLILNPVPKREEFVRYVTAISSSEVAAAEKFVVLDSDGEEMVNKYDFFKEWTEDDVVSLLNQVPIYNMLMHAFAVSSEDCSYDPLRTTESNLLKTLAVSTVLVDLLFSGLKTHNCQLHSRIASKIGTLISNTVECVSYHWHNFKTTNFTSNYGIQREFDRFIFHVAKSMFTSEKYGTIKLLTSLNFDLVSPKMLWNVLWIFHSSPDDAEEAIYKEKDVDVKLKSESNRLLLKNKIDLCSDTDAVNILKALKSMCFSANSEEEYTYRIAQEIFEIIISFPESHKQICSEGMDVLSSVAENYTFIVSYLLELLRSTDDAAVKSCSVLFREECLAKWVPKADEIEILSDWLLNCPLSSAKNHLSRIVLQRLNWGTQGGDLIMPLELHRKIGLLIVEAYSRYDIDANTWSVSKGIDQMLQLYATIRSQHFESDNGFVSWAWELLFSLKLHAMNILSPQWVKMYDGICDEDDLPDVHKDQPLLKLLLAYEQKQPAACYVVLAMTKAGHSLKNISKEGLDIISSLVERKQYAASIQCLYLILPFFVKNYEGLVENKLFMRRFLDLLLADQMGLKFSTETVVGTVLSKLTEMIKIQIYQTWKITVELSSPLIKLWIQLLVKLLTVEEYSGLLRSKSGISPVHCLLDVIVKIAFLHAHTREGLLDQMYMICDPQLMCQGYKKQAVWTLFFKNTKYCSPLLPEASSASPWFAWCVIASETQQKMIQDIWLFVISDMVVDSAMPVEDSFKKAMMMFPRSPLTIDSLPIYRWCSQAINTPANHPVLPILCQNFFLNYLQKTSSSPTQTKSVGQRFFKTGMYSSMLKAFESKLKEAEDVHYQYAEKLKKENAQKIKSSSHTVPQCPPNGRQQHFHAALAAMFQAFRTWLQDSNLHSSNICFPALEPRYQTEKLKLILQNNQGMWFDLIDIKKIEEEFVPKYELWNCRVNGTNFSLHVENKKETKLTWNLLNAGQVHSPPSVAKENKLPIKEISQEILSSWSSISQTINQDQIAIRTEAKTFGEKFSELQNMDKKYLGMIPMEYRIEDCEKIFEKACKCKRPVKFQLKIQRPVANGKVQDNMEKNRIDFAQLLRQLEKHPTPELCIAAVHMENCVRTLVKEMKTGNPKRLKTLQEIGLRLFYDQFVKTEKTVTSIGTFPPSKHIFSLCIDILGREVITSSEDQCIPLAKMLLENPSSAGLASPFFHVNDTSVETFLCVYSELVNSVKNRSSSCALFALLSKVKIKQWLAEKKTPFKSRQILLQNIGDALFHCGPTPDEELLPVYEIFKKHFSYVLLFEFPQHFTDVVSILLKGAESKKIGTDVWYEFFKSLGCFSICDSSSLEDLKQALSKFALNQILSPEQKQFVSSPPLQPNQVLESLRYFQSHFQKVREWCSELLYSKYKGYASPVAIFLGIMSHSLLKILIQDPSSNQKKTEQLWYSLHGAFQAWIDPLVIENDVVFPWSTEDEAVAKNTFKIFAMCIEFHHSQFPGPMCEKQLLSMVWNYYVNVYVKPGIRNYSVIVCHSALSDLPWKEFCPTAEDIEGMCQVLQCEIPECREFLSGIFVQIPWLEAMTYIQVSKSQVMVRQALSILAKFIIQSGWEYSIVKTKCLQKLIKKLEQLSWHLISIDTIEILLDIYCSLCNPLNLIQEQETADVSDVYILNFVKYLCGMMPVDNADSPDVKISDVQLKRILYLKKYIVLICRCPSSGLSTHSAGYKLFCSVISTLLNEVEVLINKDYPASGHLAVAMPLAKEILVIFSLLDDVNLRRGILTPTVAWINSHPRTPLLLPCIKAACTSLTNISITVAIVESCITARYNTELQDPSEAQQIWNLISTCFHLPADQEDKLLEACLKQTAFLTLYEYVLRRLAVSMTPASRTFLLHRMVDWGGKFCGAVASEAKVFLLWDKILELAVQVAEDRNLVDVQRALSAFCHSLTHFGEDREQAGIFAAIGLGKVSSFSVNFRFLCRALAAYVFAQMPDNGTLRLTPGAAGYVSSSYLDPGTQKAPGRLSEPHPSLDCVKTINSLKHILTSKPYAALKYQIEHSLKYICDSKFCFIESRHFLKDLALQTFPNVPYLYILGSVK